VRDAAPIVHIAASSCKRTSHVGRGALQL
jgi:hypothetical protein